MKKIIFALMFTFVSVFGFSQTTWDVDPMHSSINFKIKHLGISFVQGRFDNFSGKALLKGNALEEGFMTFNVDVASINTGVEMRDKHLRSEDFFDVEKFGEMNFETTSIVKEKENGYILKGKLSIKGVGKDISVPLTVGGITKNKEGKEIMGLQTKFTVNRLDYGIKYDPTGTGIAKEVEVNLYFEMIKQ